MKKFGHFKLMRKKRSHVQMSESFLSTDDQIMNDHQMENLHEAAESTNLLLDLNNGCLRDIFEYFDVESLCRLADVCTRLRPFAEKAFNRGHNQMDFNKIHSESLRRGILCKFGHLITSIRCEFEQFSEVEVDAFIKYCPNLENMILHYVDIHCDVEKLFGSLKNLELNLSYIFNGQQTMQLPNLPNLERFSIRLQNDSHLELYTNRFPKLVELNLSPGMLHNGSYELGKLLSLNPQLQRLSIECAVCDNHIKTIAQHTNLEVLRITNYGSKMFSPEQIKNSLMQLSRLKMLKRFDLISLYKIPENVVVVAPLMTAFSEKKLNLEHLHLEYLPIHSIDIQSIFNLKTLTSLYLGEIKSVSDDDLVSLATELPLLTDLWLEFKLDDESISVTTLINIVKRGKQLNQIELINVKDLKIDAKIFEALIEAASGRVNKNKKKLIINIIDCTEHLVVSVPQDVQHASRKQLQITHNKYKPNSFNKNYYYYRKFYSYNHSRNN